jgi:hypothetical protein
VLSVTVKLYTPIPRIQAKPYSKKHHYIIIISLLMSPLLRHRPSLWITRRTGHNQLRGPSVGWCVEKDEKRKKQYTTKVVKKFNYLDIGSYQIIV